MQADDVVTLEDALHYAKRVARRHLRIDHIEAESIAGSAAFRAHRDFAPGEHRSLGRYVAYCVKIQCWDFLKKRARKPASYSATQQEDPFWDAVGIAMDADTDTVVPQYYWRILCEKYIDGYPFDVLARRNGTTVPEMRRQIAMAVEMFDACVRSSER